MRLRPVLAALMLVAFLCGLLGPAHADNLERQKRAADAAAGALRDALADTDADLAAAAVAEKAAEERLGAARGRENAAEAALSSARQRDRQLAARLELAQGEQEKAEGAVSEVQDQLLEGRRAVNAIARRAYQGGHAGTLDVFMGSSSPSDFADRIQLVQGALRSEGSAVRELSALRADLAGKQAAVTQKRELIADLKDQAARNVLARQRAEVQAADARSAASSAAAAAQAARGAVEARKADEKRRLAQQEATSAQLARRIRALAIAAQKREAARKAAAKRAAAAAAAAAGAGGGGSGGGSSSGGDGGGADTGSSGGGSGGAPTGGGVLSRPDNGPITSPYGMRMHPVLHVLKLHDGTDFGAACGTPIHAAADGTVIWAQNFTGYGNQLAIDHGILNGVPVVTSYSHQERFAVGVGAHVSRGQVIGYTGQTGYATGCHVHFMVYVNGQTVNPVGWL